MHFVKGFIESKTLGNKLTSDDLLSHCLGVCFKCITFVLLKNKFNKNKFYTQVLWAYCKYKYLIDYIVITAKHNFEFTVFCKVFSLNYGV